MVSPENDAEAFTCEFVVTASSPASKSQAQDLNPRPWVRRLFRCPVQSVVHERGLDAGCVFMIVIVLIVFGAARPVLAGFNHAACTNYFAYSL